MRQIARKKDERIHASRVDQFLSRTANKTLLNAFSVGSDASKDGLRTS